MTKSFLTSIGNFIKSITGFLYLYTRYRRAKKRGECLSFKVRDKEDFISEFQMMSKIKILRDSSVHGGDVDLLCEITSKINILKLAGRHISFSKNGVKFDVYASDAVRGFLYKGYPYYPPFFALNILNDDAQLLCPYIEVYHLIYHKSDYINTDEFNNRIDKIEEKYGLKFEERSFLYLIKFLDMNGFDMPNDLKLKFIGNSRVIKETTPGKELFDGSFLVLFIRTDAKKETKFIVKTFEEIGKLKKSYQILSTDDIKWVARNFRGGNWNENGKFLGCSSIHCYDVVDYPLLWKKSALLKDQIRFDLSKKNSKKIYGLHTTDSVYESNLILEKLNDRFGR
jgi:hypothetical protein